MAVLRFRVAKKPVVGRTFKLGVLIASIRFFVLFAGLEVVTS